MGKSPIHTVPPGFGAVAQTLYEGNVYRGQCECKANLVTMWVAEVVRVQPKVAPLDGLV